MTTTDVKVTVVGDGAIGKTSMLIAYTTKKFNESDYIPTIFENYLQDLIVDGKHHTIDLCDTAGQEDYARLRILSYPKTTCFLLCYAINNTVSFRHIWTKWAPELKHTMPHTPIILVGTKSDLRIVGDPKHKLITEEKGHALAKKIHATCYLECSARRLKGLDKIIIAAVVASTMEHPLTTVRKCSVL